VANSRKLTDDGRSQMLATRNFGDWHTVVGEEKVKVNELNLRNLC